MKKLCFGSVASFDSRSKTGTMNIAGEVSPVAFNLDTLKDITAGFSEPVFGAVSKFGPHFDHHPEINEGDEVVALINVGYDREQTPSRRTLRRKVKVSDWCFTCSYNDALRIIRARPVYEIIEFLFYNGQPTSVNQKHVVAKGTALQLNHEYPKDVALDPLASEKQSLGFTYRRRFYILGPNGSRTQCPDPRRVPEGARAEVFQPTNEHGMLLATGSEIAMALGWKPLVSQKLAP